MFTLAGIIAAMTSVVALGYVTVPYLGVDQPVFFVATTMLWQAGQGTGPLAPSLGKQNNWLRRQLPHLPCSQPDAP